MGSAYSKFDQRGLYPVEHFFELMPIRTKIQIDNDQSFKGLQAKFRQRPPGGKCFKTLVSFVTDEVAKIC
jgi:hypothetical protein